MLIAPLKFSIVQTFKQQHIALKSETGDGAVDQRGLRSADADDEKTGKRRQDPRLQRTF